MATSTRRLRALKRWMKSKGFEWSNKLEFVETEERGIFVRALSELKEDDVVAKMPKEASLTVKNSGACDMIEGADLEGHLGLAFAIMYERSLGADSPWAGYLQFLPQQECVPLVWTRDEVNELLRGTELHQDVQELKTLMSNDWKKSIRPLLDSAPTKLNPEFFGIELYLAARTLIASRSFEIDDYHGSGMVPLADLFNHKTGDEDVHFTAIPSNDDSDNNVDGNTSDEAITDEDGLAQNSSMGDGNSIVSHSEGSSDIEGDPAILEMIVIKDVRSGAEVFNTYGLLGNAALLHRYGFTEQDNIYDIVNIDLELVLKWCSSLFSDRCRRARMFIWRRLGFSGLGSKDCEYFEISFDGEPQDDLIALLYVMLSSDDKFPELGPIVSKMKSGETTRSSDESLPNGDSYMRRKQFMFTKAVREALLSLADMRESIYGSESIQVDIEALERCSLVREKKKYHSLVLRINERKILQKLRTFASQHIQNH